MIENCRFEIFVALANAPHGVEAEVEDYGDGSFMVVADPKAVYAAFRQAAIDLLQYPEPPEPIGDHT